MSFNREDIRKTAKECGIENFPKEFENWLVAEHISARDAYADKQVDKALTENKPDEPTAVKDTEEYKALEKEFKDYKSAQAEKETAAAKEKAAREFYEKKGFKDKALDIAMRGSKAEITGLEIAEDGKVKSFDALDALAKGIYSDLATATGTAAGVKTPNPPAKSKVPAEVNSLKEALEQKYSKG